MESSVRKSIREKDIKAQKIGELRELRDENKYFVFFDFSGLSVGEISQIRNKLRDINSVLKVSKNTFINLVFGIRFENPTAVAATKYDPIKLVKELVNFGEDRIKGGYIGRPLLREEILTLKNMPDLPSIYLMIVGSLKSYLMRLVYSLKYPLYSLQSVLKAVEQKTQIGG